jgi:hypothetical protein
MPVNEPVAKQEAELDELPVRYVSARVGKSPTLKTVGQSRLTRSYAVEDQELAVTHPSITFGELQAFRPRIETFHSGRNPIPLMSRSKTG